MRVTKEDVRRMAKVSCLQLTDEEVEAFSHQFSELLDKADEMLTLNTDHIEPTVNVLKQTKVLRDDRVRPSADQSDVLSNARETVDGQFKVPSVFE